MIYQKHQVLEAEPEVKDIDMLNDENDDFLVYPSDEEIFFAKERWKLHLASPDEGVNIDVLKHYFLKNYGF